MTAQDATIPHEARAGRRTAQQGVGVRALIETTKPGITRLVTITSLVGFAMAATGRRWEFGDLTIAALGCVFGTFLSAAGANSLNQYAERDRDATMPRTMLRPLPSGRAEPTSVLVLGLVLSILGIGILAAVNGWVPALVSLACVLVYVFVYTPMKPWTPSATLVGTIPGSLPPLIGWTCGTTTDGPAGLLEAGGLSLFALMTVWQIPHFLAIAWMYKDDYAKGGYAVLPVVDPTGRRTVLWMLGTASALVPITISPMPAMPDRVGWVYACVALATGLAYLWLVLRLWGERTRERARVVFFASIIHLPILMVAMTGEALVRSVLMGE